MHNTVCLLREEGGRIPEMFAVSVDITARKLVQPTAKQPRASASKMRGNRMQSSVSFPNFSAFYEEFAPKLWGILIGARLPAAQAADILVNTLSIAWLGLPEYRLGEEQLLSWLLGIAYDEGLPEHYLKGLLSET